MRLSIQHFVIHGRQMSSGGVELRLAAVGSGATEGSIERVAMGLGTLHNHCLPHDWATVGQDLEVRHGPSTRRGMAGGGGKGAESGGRRFVKKRAHGAPLGEQSVHGESLAGLQWATRAYRQVFIQFRSL